MASICASIGNAGIGISPHDKKTIYYGSQYLHKSSDHGQNWDIISPDLTTNDPEKQKWLESGGLTYDVTGAEFHTTIVTIALERTERRHHLGRHGRWKRASDPRWR